MDLTRLRRFSGVRLPSARTSRSAVGFALLVVCSSLWGEAQVADPLRSSIELQSEITQQAADSQAQIDRTFEATQQSLVDYQAIMQELDRSRRYNDHLDKMVRGQEQIIASLDGQLDEIDVTRREIVPLMDRMVHTLAQLVELDMPFLLEERRARVQHLQRLIDSPDTSLAEKFRQIMEAYKLEAEYGGSVEAYRGTVAKGVGEQMVDFLRIGRVVLLYRSLDGTQAAVWDQASRSWNELPDGNSASLERGFRVARKQAAPDLLTVPVPAPVVAR